MKKFGAVLSLLFIIALVFYSFYGLTPHYDENEIVAETAFSVKKALVPLKEISKTPHYLGSEGHETVRNYLLSELEKLGLETQTQEGFVLSPESKTLTKPKNMKRSERIAPNFFMVGKFVLLKIQF